MEVSTSGTIANEGIMNMIEQIYPEEWSKMKNIYKDTSNATFSKFLKAKGYFYMKRYRKAKGYGWETRASYQPTQKFYDDFEKRGYASTRPVLDGRDKKIITYTGLIRQLIETEAFRLSFFQWAEVIEDTEIKYNIFGNHEKMEPVKYIILDDNTNKPTIKTQEF